MTKFKDLQDGDVVSLSLVGTFQVENVHAGHSYNYLCLHSLDGLDDWYFDLDDDETESWNIELKDSITSPFLAYQEFREGWSGQ